MNSYCYCLCYLSYGNILTGNDNGTIKEWEFRNNELKCIGEKKDIISTKVFTALVDVGLKNKVHEYPGNLSGGEQQRVAIARAIVNNPKLLLCDEPTGNLDPEKSMEIMKVLESINKSRGTTIIMATHDKEIVNKMKKQVITLKDGHLVKFKQKGTYVE